MNILITGVNGLLGMELAKVLCNGADHFVYGLSRSVPLIHSHNYKHIQADLGQPDFLGQLPRKLDAIVHLAQSEKFRDFPAAAPEVFNVNTLSTLKLLDYARVAGVKNFIYASSGGVYGNKDIGFTEDSPVMGNGDLGFYLSTKLCSEIITDNYSVFFNVVQLRFFFVYGERQHKGMLIPRLLNSVMSSTPIMLTGSEGIKINPIYVSDAAKAVQKALNINHSDKINVGGSQSLSIKQIADVMSQKLGIDPVFNRVEGGPKNLIGDIRKMKRELHDPEISFDKGIEKLIAYGASKQ